MFDRLVADGDRTTTGGFVIARSGMYNENGKQYARKENHATCGNCKGGWPIYGTASDWMDDGLPMVKDYDRVLCPCGKNFVLASSGSNLFYSTSGSASPKTAVTREVTQPVVYDQRFTLTDATGSPFSDTYYTVRLPTGELRHSVPDSTGMTDRYETDNANSIHFYLGHRRDI